MQKLTFIVALLLSALSFAEHGRPAASGRSTTTQEYLVCNVPKEAQYRCLTNLDESRPEAYRDLFGTAGTVYFEKKGLNVEKLEKSFADGLRNGYIANCGETPPEGRELTTEPFSFKDNCSEEISNTTVNAITDTDFYKKIMRMSARAFNKGLALLGPTGKNVGEGKAPSNSVSGGDREARTPQQAMAEVARILGPVFGLPEKSVGEVSKN